MTRPRAVRLPIALLLGCSMAAVVGCSNVTIDKEVAPSPPPPTHLLIVGAIGTPDPAATRAVRRFRRELTQALCDAVPGAVEVSTRMPAPLPADALVITGRFATIDAGSELTRLLIGFGAGRPTIEGTFEVVDATGKPLLRFDQDVHSSDGRGWNAHWDPYDPDSGIDAFAAETAEIIADWYHGEDL